MPTLSLTPSQAAYASKGDKSVIGVKLDGGTMRTRVDFISNVEIVTATWDLNPQQYDYLQAFFVSAIGHGSMDFDVNLVLRGAVEELHTVKIVPGTFKLAGVDGHRYRVRADLEVTPLPVDEEFDLALVWLYEGLGSDLTGYFDSLERLTNFTLDFD